MIENVLIICLDTKIVYMYLIGDITIIDGMINLLKVDLNLLLVESKTQ